MKVSGGGFDQCYNAQAAVATESMLILAPISPRPATTRNNWRRCWQRCKRCRTRWSPPQTLLADTGYFSDKNVDACAAASIKPLIAICRDEHHPSLARTFRRAGTGAPWPASGRRADEARAQARRAGAPTRYASKRSSRCSASSSRCMKFRQFLLRGLDAARGEWKLVTMAWNLKRMFALSQA